MKKGIWLLPAGAIVTAGTVLLIRKHGKADPSAAATGKNETAPKKQAAAMAAPKSASYSFVSGFQNARTVNLAFSYDAEKYSCREIAEDFPAYTDVSHAAVVEGEDFSMQIEYRDFAAGEDFAAFTGLLREKQKGFAPVQYGSNEGYRYYNGDNVCFVFPATDFSCILVTVMLARGSDLDYRDIHENEELAAFLATFSIQ